MAISGVIHLMLGAFSLASAIPKGLKLSAQGCEERATLGQPTADSINPARVLSIPHIAFVKFDFVAFQQKPKLILKRDLPVMFLLACDVAAH